MKLIPFLFLICCTGLVTAYDKCQDAQTGDKCTCGTGRPAAKGATVGGIKPITSNICTYDQKCVMKRTPTPGLACVSCSDRGTDVNTKGRVCGERFSSPQPQQRSSSKQDQEPKPSRTSSHVEHTSHSKEEARDDASGHGEQTQQRSDDHDEFFDAASELDEQLTEVEIAEVNNALSSVIEVIHVEHIDDSSTLSNFKNTLIQALANLQKKATEKLMRATAVAVIAICDAIVKGEVENDQVSMEDAAVATAVANAIKKSEQVFPDLEPEKEATVAAAVAAAVSQANADDDREAAVAAAVVAAIDKLEEEAPQLDHEQATVAAVSAAVHEVDAQQFQKSCKAKPWGRVEKVLLPVEWERESYKNSEDLKEEMYLRRPSAPAYLEARVKYVKKKESDTDGITVVEIWHGLRNKDTGNPQGKPKLLLRFQMNTEGLEEHDRKSYSFLKPLLASIRVKEVSEDKVEIGVVSKTDYKIYTSTDLASQPHTESEESTVSEFSRMFTFKNKYIWCNTLEQWSKT